MQDDKHPLAEDAASTFQQVKADLPRLFLECNHLSACLPSVCQLPRFSTGPDQAHLHAPISYDIVNSIDSKDFAGLAYPASQALLLGHTFMLTNSDDEFSGAWQPDPMAFASWCQKVISHKSNFKGACQASGLAVHFTHHAKAVSINKAC